MCPSFDAAAETYDYEFEHLPATARIRGIVRELAIRRFPPGGTILELNCGTGTDAIALSQSGFHVLATDASPSMISVARAKMEARSARQVEFRVIPFEQVSVLEGKMFDGVFSNMGGLNCLADLRPLARSLATILKPGGFFVATLLSDFCLWETAAFLLRLNFRGAFRRRRTNGSEVSISGDSVKVFFHSPSSVRDAFSPFFGRSSLLGLNILTPPPSSARAYQHLGHGRRVLESLDNAIAEVPPFNRLGDHFVIALQRS